MWLGQLKHFHLGNDVIPTFHLGNDVIPTFHLGNDVIPTFHLGNDLIPTFPCNYEAALCVAATTSTDELADYSNYGVHSVQIAAPGDGCEVFWTCFAIGSFLILHRLDLLQEPISSVPTWAIAMPLSAELRWPHLMWLVLLPWFGAGWASDLWATRLRTYGPSSWSLQNGHRGSMAGWLRAC